MGRGDLGYMSCVCHAFASVQLLPCGHLLERTDLLALFCNVCVFITFSCAILGQPV